MMKSVFLFLFFLFLSQKSFADVDLTQAAGQMMLVGFDGAEINENSPIVLAIKKYHIGGVFLLGRHKLPTGEYTTNIENPPQLKKLLDDLQFYAKKYNNPPLFIGIDEEGGLINRLNPSLGFDNQDDLSEWALGKNDDQKQIFDVTSKRAKLLKQFGINLNFAPVADLNINPDNPAIGVLDRSFGADPYKVTKDLTSAIKAYKKEKILCTLKHFPGLGSADANTDFDNADVTDTWQKKELIPYKKLIELNRTCPLIMVAHTINKKLDPTGTPTSLSQPVVRGLLRNKLNYKGLIITDDMDAYAIQKNYPHEIAFQKALTAGNNIIMIHTGISDCNMMKDAELLYNTILILAENNANFMQHVLKSYKKIMKLKSSL